MEQITTLFWGAVVRMGGGVVGGQAGEDVQRADGEDAPYCHLGLCGQLEGLDGREG